MNIQTEKAQGTMFITDASESNKFDAIKGFFSMLGPVKEPAQGVTFSPEITIKKAPKDLDESEVIVPLKDRKQVEIELSTQPFEGKEASAKTEPSIKKPDLIHSTRTLSPTIGEMLGVAHPQDVPEEEPEWYKTGIKYKEGIPHYKLRYWCKNLECKDKSNDYIKEDQETVCCRKCGQKMQVRKAAGEHLKRDEWGNFFIADKPE